MQILSSVQIRLIRQTFRVIAKHPREFTEMFYDKVFEIDSSLRDMFSSDLVAQEMKFIRMVAVFVSLAENPEDFVTQSRDLGRRHLGYGVEDAHYDITKIALLWALEKQLGILWTPAIRDAWVRLYTNLVTLAIEGSRDAESVGCCN